MEEHSTDWALAPDWAEALGLRVYEHDTSAVDYAWLSRFGYHYTNSGVADKKCHPFDSCGTGIRDFILISFKPLGPASIQPQGIPPIGSTVRIVKSPKLPVWPQAEQFIGADCTLHAVFMTGDVQMVAVEHQEEFICCCFRAEMVRTPEQIAAEERTKAIDELVSTTCISRGEAARIYDCGWRLMEPKPE